MRTGESAAPLVSAVVEAHCRHDGYRCRRSTRFSPSPGSGRSSRRPIGYIAVLPALILSGLMLGALGMLLSSVSKQLENCAGAMNFVIFPMFFASSALYPLWRVREGSPCWAGQLEFSCSRRRMHGAVHGRGDTRL